MYAMSSLMGSYDISNIQLVSWQNIEVQDLATLAYFTMEYCIV